MAEKVMKCNIRREQGYLYFIDKNGDVSASVMARGSTAKRGSKLIHKAGIKKEVGYLYFLDSNGDISRAKLARGRRKEKQSI